MSSTDKIAEALRRSLPCVPAAARSTVQAMLRPETLAIIAGTLVVWAGSHFFGIGEIVDIILLTVGALTLGFAVFEGVAALLGGGAGRRLCAVACPCLAKALGAYRFPLAGPYPYVTVSQLIGEGQAIGPIILGGTLFYVSITQ